MAEPRFHAVGAWIEDARDTRPDICKIPHGDAVENYGGKRTYEEACELAWQIADALNRCYPKANSKIRK